MDGGLTKHLIAEGVLQRGSVSKLQPRSDSLLPVLSNLLFHLTKEKRRGRAAAGGARLSMEVRFNQEPDGMGLKNGLKKGKDEQDSHSRSFLKEQHDSVSPSGTLENCEKHRGGSGDPDYCRRILVRGKTAASTPQERPGPGRTKKTST